MKKFFLILTFVFLCSSANLFAKSDIQIGLGTPVLNFAGSNFDLKNIGLLSININNHNFFGEKGIVGFSESITFSPLTSDMFYAYPGFNLSAFAGPSFNIPVTEDNDFIVSAGFKYFMNFKRNVTSFPKNGEEKTITVTGTKIYSAYAFSLDLQLKLLKDEPVTFVMGLPASIGVGNENFKQVVKDRNPASYYKTLSSTSELKGFLELGFPYFMLCINL